MKKTEIRSQREKIIHGGEHPSELERLKASEANFVG